MENTITADDVIGVPEAARVKGCAQKTIYAAMRAGDLPAWKKRPMLLLRSDLEKWTRRPVGGPSGMREPGKKTRRLGGTFLHLGVSAAAKKFRVSRQAVHQARHKLRKWDAIQAANGNGQAS